MLLWDVLLWDVVSPAVLEVEALEVDSPAVDKVLCELDDSELAELVDGLDALDVESAAVLGLDELRP